MATMSAGAGSSREKGREGEGAREGGREGEGEREGEREGESQIESERDTGMRESVNESE